MKAAYYPLAETLYEYVSIFFRGTLIWLVFAILFVGAIVALVVIKRRRQS